MEHRAAVFGTGPLSADWLDEDVAVDSQNFRHIGEEDVVLVFLCVIIQLEFQLRLVVDSSDFVHEINLQVSQTLNGLLIVSPGVESDSFAVSLVLWCPALLCVDVFVQMNYFIRSVERKRTAQVVVLISGAEWTGCDSLAIQVEVVSQFAKYLLSGDEMQSCLICKHIIWGYDILSFFFFFIHGPLSISREAEQSLCG